MDSLKTNTPHVLYSQSLGLNEEQSTKLKTFDDSVIQTDKTLKTWNRSLSGTAIGISLIILVLVVANRLSVSHKLLSESWQKIPSQGQVGSIVGGILFVGAAVGYISLNYPDVRKNAALAQTKRTQYVTLRHTESRDQPILLNILGQFDEVLQKENSKVLFPNDYVSTYIENVRHLPQDLATKDHSGDYIEFQYSKNYTQGKPNFDQLSTAGYTIRHAQDSLCTYAWKPDPKNNKQYILLSYDTSSKTLKVSHAADSIIQDLKIPLNQIQATTDQKKQEAIEVLSNYEAYYRPHDTEYNLLQTEFTKQDITKVTTGSYSMLEIQYAENFELQESYNQKLQTEGFQMHQLEEPMILQRRTGQESEAITLYDMLVYQAYGQDLKKHIGISYGSDHKTIKFFLFNEDQLILFNTTPLDENQ